MQCQAQGRSISKPVVILLPKDIRQSLDHRFLVVVSEKIAAKHPNSKNQDTK